VEVLAASSVPDNSDAHVHSLVRLGLGIYRVDTTHVVLVGVVVVVVVVGGTAAAALPAEKPQARKVGRRCRREPPGHRVGRSRFLVRFADSLLFPPESDGQPLLGRGCPSFHGGDPGAGRFRSPAVNTAVMR